MRCQTFLGLCYKPVGIMFWKYDSHVTGGNQGIIDIDGNPRPELYEVIKNDINPYLKAIDSTYLGLTWDTAYAVNFENGVVRSVEVNRR